MTELSLETVLRIVEIISILGGGAAVIMRHGRSTERVEAAIARQNEISNSQQDGIGALKEEIKKLGDVITQIAVQEVRLDNMSERISLLDRRYEEIRHGEGFVYPLGSHLGNT